MTDKLKHWSLFFTGTCLSALCLTLLNAPNALANESVTTVSSSLAVVTSTSFDRLNQVTDGWLCLLIILTLAFFFQVGRLVKRLHEHRNSSRTLPHPFAATTFIWTFCLLLLTVIFASSSNQTEQAQQPLDEYPITPPPTEVQSFSQDGYSITIESPSLIESFQNGFIDTTFDCQVTAKGSFDGSVSVSVLPTTLIAPNGAQINVESSSLINQIFSTNDIAANRTKTLPIHITGSNLLPNAWIGCVDYCIASTRLFPESTEGWFSPDNGNSFYYIENEHTVKGWLQTDKMPNGGTGDTELFWLDKVTGLLSQGKTIETTESSFAYAKDDGTIVRGAFNDGKGSTFLADNNGNLLWGDKVGWVVADYGHGINRYYIDEETHGAKTGFFSSSSDSYFGTSDGFALCGKQTWNDFVLLADDNGKLISEPGWLKTDKYDDDVKEYFLDVAATDQNGKRYYGSRTNLFAVDDSQYYGDTTKGYIVKNRIFHLEDRTMKANENGIVTEILDWSLDKSDWGKDDDYLEGCRARAAKNGSSTDYYITVDNRQEGGGRVIVFHYSDTTWVALAGWYANVGRWTGSGNEIGTRSIPGLHQISDRIEEGTTSQNDPWVIPYFTDYLHWIDPETGKDDGQGFHYTPNPNAQGNDMSGCTAFTTEWRAKWIFDNVPDGTTVDVFGAAHGVNYD